MTLVEHTPSDFRTIRFDVAIAIRASSADRLSRLPDPGALRRACRAAAMVDAAFGADDFRFQQLVIGWRPGADFCRSNDFQGTEVLSVLGPATPSPLAGARRQPSPRSARRSQVVTQKGA